MTMQMGGFFARLERVGLLTAPMAQALGSLALQQRRYEPRETVISRGEPVDEGFVVCSGWASRSISLGDGRQQVVNFMLPGDLFDLQIFAGGETDHTVTALTDLVIASVSRRDVLALLRDGSALSDGIWRSAAQEIAILREQIVRNGRRSATERVAHLLLELHARLLLVEEAGQDRFEMPIGQKHIADALGLSYVHLSRVFGQLERSRMILRERSVIIFPDPAALAEVAKFSPAYLFLQDTTSTR